MHRIFVLPFGRIHTNSVAACCCHANLGKRSSVTDRCASLQRMTWMSGTRKVLTVEYQLLHCLHVRHFTLPHGDCRRIFSRHMANWRRVPADKNNLYWHPDNRGFGNQNSRFVCQKCRAIVPFDWTCDRCQGWLFWLGTGRGLPGIFCMRCGNGQIAWTCPSCNEAQRLFLAFEYDAEILEMKPKETPISALKSIFRRG